MDQRLQERLRAVAKRYRSLRLWQSLAVVWLIAAAVGGVALWLFTPAASPLSVNALAVGVFAVAVAAIATVYIAFSFRSPVWAAHRLENQFPDLDQRLITAISQRPSAANGALGYLQQTVVEEALAHARRRRWEYSVSEAQLSRAKLLNLPSLLVLAVVLTGLWTQRGPALPVAEDSVAQQRGQSGIRVAVDPGNTELQRGRRLIVTARFGDNVPKEAALVVQGAQGVQRIAMTRSLNDPLFGGQMLEVTEDVNYHVEFAEGKSETYHVTVFEYPRLVRSDARIVHPEYTAISEKLVEDTRRITAVQGSELTWLCYLNKQVAEATLVDEEGEDLPLTPDDAAPFLYSASITLRESRRWTLKLIDADGRSNEYPPQLVATVMPNEPPKIKLALARDLRVSPLEEVPVEASFQDDFGLVRSGLAYTLAGESQDVVLASAEASERQTRQEGAHILDFESMDAEPDQLLSYYFWAEDLAPDGQLRRTSSDMFFAEVRHFEEIFREGQQPPGGQSQQQQQQQQGGQNAQQAEQLAELQKQIITGTWNIIRRETKDELSSSFVDDVTLLQESQATAIEELESLAERVSDDQSQAYVDEVRTQMAKAVELLSAAADGPEKDSLTPALAAEQAAYQGLLRLRAREHEVIRGQQQQQQGGSQSGSSARFQQQLEELQLSNEQNRYETERQAQAPQENDQQREMRQVLNRLRELAQRQEDLNEQIQQLQTALQQAQTEQEREEIERQLKRLRDQQEEMLRDTDELAERMSDSPNQSELQESRQQVEQTRENVRQSADALSEQNVSEALSAGTRAERQFEQMRDEFRRRTANQFSEDMQQMREQARELDEQQQELGEQLAGIQEENRGSLRGEGNRQQLREQLDEQQQDLDELLQRMEDTVRNAESSEPLLAESLYDAVREARQQQLTERLEMTRELLRSGMDPQAQQLEESAREGITNLRQNVEQAAEQVLGDETEALQRALSELEQLSRELNEEIEREDPRLAEEDQRPGGSGQPAGAPARENESQSDGSQEPSEQQRGQGRSANPNENPSDSGENRRPSSDQQEQNQQGQRSGEGQQGDSNQAPDDQSDPSQQSGQPRDQPSQNQPSQNQSDQNQSGQANRSEQQSPSEGQGGGQGGRESDQAGRGDMPPEPSETDNANPPNPFDPQQQGGRQGGAEQRGPQYDGGGGGGLDRFGGESLGSAPITGDSFREWSDRLRDVEEIVDDPELRSEATRIRERARDIRREHQQSGQAPQWPLVRRLVAEPLEELKQRVSEELLRRSAEKNALVPIDRDPVPDQFIEQVRRYYERLGSGN